MLPPAVSWGHWPRLEASSQRLLTDRTASLPSTRQTSLLAYGNGRSYGDVCLNQHGTLLRTRGLDRFIRFDALAGVLECESGVLLSEIIDLVLPHGWFPAVTPGTALVTVGGAIANDVHGKNHHRMGCFSHHVVEFELLRSDGTRSRCSLQENADLFRATVGGLGLTGLITRASLKLRRIDGPWIRGDSQRFDSLDEFFVLSRQADLGHEYTVAWIDCAAHARRVGRGIFMRGNHAPGPDRTQRRSISLPLTPPVSLVNRCSVSGFNAAYFYRPGASDRHGLWHFRPFLYPLDGILHWNRIYGPNGFFQYQCVIPEGAAAAALEELLAGIAASGIGSFLTVLKNFGAVESLGMLSFARPGTTLAIDFPNRGAATLGLLESLDAITRRVGGAVYPAKDARMSMNSFQQFFPAWKQFSDYVDPQFSSSFWRRVTAGCV